VYASSYFRSVVRQPTDWLNSNCADSSGTEPHDSYNHADLRFLHLLAQTIFDLNSNFADSRDAGKWFI